ncbi:hypothetical protein [Campylobacter rectus]|uniref:hypothetical protein n=1 Tax=Campylobacter rectus TaxID=203 RepID=UPI0028DC2E82|nr:hypothetical protein [Campylobacter rectus]
MMHIKNKIGNAVSLSFGISFALHSGTTYPAYVLADTKSCLPKKTKLLKCERLA